jgi:hypothetical protein
MNVLELDILWCTLSIAAIPVVRKKRLFLYNVYFKYLKDLFYVSYLSLWYTHYRLSAYTVNGRSIPHFM